jgi:Tfp pilus assembly protein PilW
MKGLSLVELLVSIVLGLLLTTGIVTVYLESKSNYIVEEEMARLQENGRFALNYLKRELTLAGFYAGNLEAEDLPAVAIGGTDCAASNWALDASEAVDLISDFASAPLLTTNAKTWTCLVDSDIQLDTDILSVKRSAGEATLKDGVFRTGVTAAQDAQWYLRLENYGDIMGWVYVNPGENFPSGMTAGSQVDYWEMYASIFYIQKFSASGDTVPTLCMERLSGDSMASECLVEGVEDMQVEFGIDTDGDGVADRYEDAPSAAQLRTAVVARVYLLLRSLGEVVGYTNSKTYQLGQKAIASKNDGFLRRVFSTTVQMRNSTLPVG